MLECWRESADQRPSFASLARTLRDLESKHKVRDVGCFKIASTFLFILILLFTFIGRLAN